MLSGIKIKPKQPDVDRQSPVSNLQRESWMSDAGEFAVNASFAKPAPIRPADAAPAKPKPIDLANIAVNRKQTPQVGDGGASWRRRIEKRQKEKDHAEASQNPSSSVSSRSRSQHPLLSSGYREPQTVDRREKSDDVFETVDDLNQLAAEALRSKLIGDLKKHDAIQKKIEAIRSRPRIEIVPDIDRQGRPVNICNSNRDDIEYLAQQERLQSRNQFQTDSALEIARNSRFSTSTDEQFDTSHSEMFERAPKKQKGKVNEEEAKRRNVISEHRKFQSQNDNCLFCLESKRVQRHLIVSIGKFCYISVPETPPLGLGHCYIVPSSHTSSVTEMDENVYEEVQAVKQQLVRMFESISQKAVFMETCPSRSKHHAVIECIPMDDEMYIDAPIYFKKGLLESDEEWSSHKKIIEISRKKPLRSAIPKGFPYFSIEFGSDGSGYAHVIEDERKFSVRFGLQIICGLLQEHPEIIFRAKPESREIQLERVRQFREMWNRFDCLTSH